MKTLILALLTVGLLFGVVDPALAGQNTLTWVDTSTNETAFAIHRCTGAGCTPTAADLVTTLSNVTTFVDTAVTEGSTYCYTVTARNGTLDSPPSNVACRLVAATVPSAPTGLTVTSP